MKVFLFTPGALPRTSPPANMVQGRLLVIAGSDCSGGA